MRGMQRLVAGAVAGLASTLAIRAWLRQSRRISFRNRVALVTGGSRGLGLVMARQLASEGARVAICARDSAELARAELDLQQFRGDVLAHTCDVTRAEDVQQLIAEIEKRMGPVEILINNAGIITVGPHDTMTHEDYELALKTHLWGPLYAIERVLPGMKQRGEGRIVNIASIGGKLSVPHLIPYSVSKFALVGLSEGLRSELAQDGVLVTTVCPGLMRTGSPRHAFFKGQHRAEYVWFSISDSLPLVSIRADRAARQILDACRYGDAEVILTPQASLAARFGQFAPEITADILAAVNHLLPPSNGNRRAFPGYASQSSYSPSWLTTLNEEAARSNNEMAPRDGA